MKKLLLVALLVLFLSRLLLTHEIWNIKCTLCLIRPPGHACIEEPTHCVLHEEQSCFRQTVYFGRIPLYTKLGCQRNCMEVKEKKEKLKITETIFCCNNYFYCNA